MKHIIILFSFFLFSFSISAQNSFKLKGVVKDTLGESIIGASVVLTSKVDSVMVGFSLTDGSGRFAMNKIPEGEYLLQVTYMGYKNHIEYAKIPREDNLDYDFGKITLLEGNTLLEEVVVMEDRIPIMIKKDTIEYNAGSFEVHENAIVEELLRELPGIEVAEDGSIKANGKDVQNILVDGKEFFGNDPKMATKNLPAKAIDKVQVYDKESEAAQFSGMVASDEEETTINLKLKEEYKKGYIGKVEAGGGTDKTFISNVNLNKFDKKNQVSIIARMNNTTNQSGLDMNETIQFAGGLQSLLSDSDDGRIALETNNAQYNGINTVGLLGVNYNWVAKNKFRIFSNYKLDIVNSDLDQTSFQKNKLDDLAYNTIDTLFRDSRQYTNTANLNLKFKPDSTFRVTWNNNVNFSFGNSDVNSNNLNHNLINNITNKQASISDSKDNRWRLKSSFLVQKKIKSGIVFNSRTTANYRNINQSYSSLSNTSIFDENQTNLSSIDLNRRGEDSTPNIELSQRLAYIQPLGKFIKLENSYKISNGINKENNNLDEFGDDIWIKNENLSRDFRLNHLKQQAQTKLQYGREKYTIRTGVVYQNSKLNFEEGNASYFTRNYHYILPNAGLNFELGRSSFVNLNYNTNVSMPDIRNLSPVINDNNPSRIVQGNINLKPQYSHSLNFGYNFFDQFTFNSLNLFGSVRRTLNTVIQESSIDENLIESVSPINAGSSTDYNVNLSYGTPLRFIKSRFNINANSMINIRPNNINGITNDYQQFIQTIGASIGNKKKKKWDVKVGYDFNFNSSKNLDSKEKSSSFMDHSYLVRTNYRFKKGFRIGNELKYRAYSNSDQEFLLWDAFIEKTVFRNEKGLFKLSVADILNNNRGIRREANNFYSREERSNTRGRYFMLSFSYNLTFFEKGRKK
jgi:hypothetical protein